MNNRCRWRAIFLFGLLVLVAAGLLTACGQSTPSPSVPTIAVSPSKAVGFNAVEAGHNPPGQTLKIHNSGAGTLNWAATCDAGWLILSPTSGSSSGEINDVTVAVNIAGMSPGDHSATIAISAPGAANTPQTVGVNLTVSPLPNKLPDEPSNPSPPDGAAGVSISVDLSWTGGGPDVGDTVTYAVYFGPNSSPPLVSSDQSDTTYSPGTLSSNTKYYWKVIAADNRGAETAGPVWTFTTTGAAGVTAATVRIDAPSRVAPDSDFTVKVKVTGLIDFDAAQYDIVFDDTVLRLDNVTAGDIAGTEIPVDSWNLVAAGRARIVQNVPGVAGVSGSGFLAVLHFHVIGDPGDDSDIDLRNGVLNDNTAAEIAANWLGDTVTVAGGAPPAGVTVSLGAPAGAAPNSDFTVNVDISAVTDFDVASYDVVFNDTVLRLDDVTAGDIAGTVIPVDAWNLIAAGRARIVQNVPGLEGVSGAGQLAVLHFHVKGSSGSSTSITLQNGLLGDNSAKEIIAQWVGASVNVS
jgi:hypothetical protein